MLLGSKAYLLTVYVFLPCFRWALRMRAQLFHKTTLSSIRRTNPRLFDRRAARSAFPIITEMARCTVRLVTIRKRLVLSREASFRVITPTFTSPFPRWPARCIIIRCTASPAGATSMSPKWPPCTPGCAPGQCSRIRTITRIISTIPARRKIKFRRHRVSATDTRRTNRWNRWVTFFYLHRAFF